MSEQYPGGFITKEPPTPQGPYEYSAAYGIWSMSQQAYYQKNNLWPVPGNVPPVTVDTKFNYVSMLLNGNGVNGAQNNTFLDSSPSARTVTRVGTPTQGSFSPYGPDWANYFDGGSTAAISFTAKTFTGDFTWECWYFADKLGSNFGNYTMLMGELNTTNIQFAVYTDGSIKYYNSLSSVELAPAGTISKGVWYHLALVRNGSTTTLYVNGTYSGQRSDSGTRAIAVVGNILPYSNQFAVSGYLSNVRLNTSALYNADFTPSTTPLTAVGGTVLLTCQSNRFIDNSSAATALVVLSGTSVQRFNPFGASAAYSTATIGGSGYFSTNNYLTVTGLGTISSSDAYCYEMWVYPTEFRAGEMRLFGSQVNDPLLQFNGNTELQFFVSNTFICSYSTTFVPNQWYHIAITRNAGTSYLYVNGIQRASGGNGYGISNKQFSIGAQETSPTIGLIGYMTDFRPWIGTPAYGSNFTPPTSPMTAVGSYNPLLLNFQNAAIYDSAMMNDLETVGDAQVSTAVVKYGSGSMKFDGSGDYLQGPQTPNLSFGTGDFTVECWAQWNTGVAAGGFVGSGSIGGMDFAYLSGSLRIGRVNTAWDSTFSSWTPTAGTWYHIAFTRNNGVARAFVDGVQIGSNSSNTNDYYANGGVRIGTSNGGDRNFNGYIDDLRITKGYARYTTTFTPPNQAFPTYGPT